MIAAGHKFIFITSDGKFAPDSVMLSELDKLKRIDAQGAPGR